VVALLNHLELETAVIGGPSLGANVALEVAVRNPDRVEGLIVQMPVLDNAVAAIAALFTPILLGLRIGRPFLGPASRIASRIPRSHELVDGWLDFIRQPPSTSADVLEGMMLGETVPHRDERREIFQPALVVGHHRDPVHPFSDSGMLAGELAASRLIEAGTPFDWKFRPTLLATEMAKFLSEVWEEAEAPANLGDWRQGNGAHQRAAMGR
jgi:pimeloyl-ACP methyl ester carboxylesterase